MTPADGARIISVEVLPLRIPYPTPRRFGRHVIEAGDNVLVRLRSEAGHVGYGEAISRPYIYGESAASIVTAVREWFAPQVIGRTAFEVAHAWRDWSLVAGNPAAKSGLDMAMHDLQAQAVGLPLWQWLGGTDARVPLSWILTYADPVQVGEETERRLAEGYRTFKVKVSPAEARDERVLGEVVARLPQDASLYVDANGSLSHGDAIRRIRRFGELGVTMIEDPLPTSDLAGRRAVWVACDVPILADETATTREAVAVELAGGALDAVSLKVFRTGFHPSRLIAETVAASGRCSVIGGQGESHVGTVLAAHFASAARALGHTTVAAETASALRFDFDLIAGGTPFQDGALVLGDGPGSGITLDEDAVARLAALSPVAEGGGWIRC